MHALIHIYKYPHSSHTLTQNTHANTPHTVTQIHMFTHTPSYTKVLVTQSCPTPHDAMDSIPPGSSVHGILQARIVEWFAMPSCGDLLNPGIKPVSPALQADSLLLSHWESLEFHVLIH